MQLFLSGVITVAVAAGCFYFDKKTSIGTLKPFYKQTIYGACFAIAAIFATELGGASIGGALINARDAAIVVAGLLFGPWAGILAAIWAAAERYFVASLVFGMGTYTQLACSLATLFAGCFSALFYVLVFRKHRPYVIHAVVFVIITEVVHMILIPFTHLGDLETAIMLMVEIFFPIILSNVLTAACAVFVTSAMEIKFSGHRLRDVIREKDIFFSQDLFYSFQFWLLLVIIVAFAANILIISRLYGVMSLEASANKYQSELKIMKSLIYQDYGYFNNLTPDKLACVYADQWSDEKVVAFEVADEDYNIISNNSKFPELGKFIVDKDELSLFRVRLDDETLYVMYINVSNCKLISYSYEKYEMYLPYFTSSMTIFIQIFVFGLLMFAVFILLKLLVGNNLDKINRSLHEITQGNLDEHVDVYSHKEFATLSDSINATVDTLKKYIDDEANRYKEEFEMAKQIQLSALPNVFPPFPNDPEIDLYAKYKPAKIVGGDFYDYYYIGKNRLAFLIADVSGKGVPAAMFMMRAKTAFRVFADKKDNPADVLEAVNNYLCENNEAEMFVTAWLGMVDISTGRLEYSSAGHNPPALIDPENGNVKFIESSPSLVLGAMENKFYKNYGFVMNPGEKLMLYTDGIIEAHDVDNHLYGDDRFLNALTKHKDKTIRDICETLAFEVDEYSTGQEQFDDYSLLCFIYNGSDDSKALKKNYWESEITVFSKTESVNKVMERCEETLKYSNAPANFIQMFDVCIDEIFSNIVKFSYKRPNEYISVRIVIDEREERKFATVTFVDTGPRFDPLSMESPDVTLSAEEREIGGLGIFMVREMMDDMHYEYKSLANWLTITKYFD